MKACMWPQNAKGYYVFEISTKEAVVFSRSDLLPEKHFQLQASWIISPLRFSWFQNRLPKTLHGLFRTRIRKFCNETKYTFFVYCVNKQKMTSLIVKADKVPKCGLKRKFFVLDRKDHQKSEICQLQQITWLGAPVFLFPFLFSPQRGTRIWVQEWEPFCYFSLLVETFSLLLVPRAVSFL